MGTEKQRLGKLGEALVAKTCACPKCSSKRSLKLLPLNFKCADLICDFCGFLAQVKTMTSKDPDKVPLKVLGAAWNVQNERMKEGIFFPLYIVQVSGRSRSIYYLAAEHQEIEIFVKRKPLSKNAKRAGWQGFYYDFKKLETKLFQRLL